MDPSRTEVALVELIAILSEARGLLAREEHATARSSWWSNAAEGLRELDGLMAILRSGQLPRRLHLEVLFAPTGPLQEMSAACGWGDAYLVLGARFEATMSKLGRFTR